MVQYNCSQSLSDYLLRVLHAEMRMQQSVHEATVPISSPSVSNHTRDSSSSSGFGSEEGWEQNTSVHRVLFTSKQPFPTMGAVIK